MVSLSADARCGSALITNTRSCGNDAFVLELQLSAPIGELRAGRFAMLSPENGAGPVIPRPISIYDYDGGIKISFLIQILGRGTRVLAALRPGHKVSITVPLGNGFPETIFNREAVAVAGGVGCAPFLTWLRQREAQSKNTHMIYGARSADRLYELDAFQQAPGRLVCATDDGSLGFVGNAVQAVQTEIAEGRISSDAVFLACGPAPLLHGFAAWAREQKVEAYLSLETYMGCGIGVCNACPTPSSESGAFSDWPWVKTCIQGPVFRLSDIRF
ncbi:MAG: hypothetical protein HOM34_01685 [Planctomycetes bacterium]|jgi:dihydroorotate dehydrogenase electron transfer subunit|nr:hypothetical protein [Planctomycetota bacterium]MBT4029099.1 hypothetical protein [Planctomycetota bacterium]MBT4560477.1 hypothetical protein [Planctomycetota bacterium]MBT5119413.1 hypothetical protein [Planctomycetota bacterium]MBT7011907.1 hypothetical protein [Planctomycetota bacterium]